MSELLIHTTLDIYMVVGKPVHFGVRSIKRISLQSIPYCMHIKRIFITPHKIYIGILK